ncbi:protein-L-isoaspartate O-methyltransferase [Candidatus Aerophobetes bacterium]|uniref:Protein-L-isoaspartate O-methyltransferase n=2 Tax=Aerophobetes bacterium TaxID=2030807 RepID=A0A662CZL2_UNCAE|nr:MAG: protein-L-isoaspartate O-methyltransferase [Candidatus Aerophobetes bacterium]
MDYNRLREEMVKKQLIARGIKDGRVLEVFRRLKREKFVPPEVQKDAYEDFPLPIGEGQTISQPYMVALMTQCLELRGGERVLEIGTGSGYQTAVLAELAKEVYSVERINSLAQRTGKLLKKLGYTNIRILVANGTLGWEEFSPYDRILVTAGAKEVPQPLLSQLKEGGIMVIPVGDMYSQELEVIRKEEDSIKTETVEKCVFVPLIGMHGWKESAENE